jgi:SAM-dependent methyltransferase
MDHLQRTRLEFTRQAAGFAASAAITDRGQTLRLVEAIGPDVNGRVLDVACGPGIVTAELAAVAREVVAFDLTAEMLAMARTRCEQAGYRNVTFREGSADALPYPDGSFDAVVTRLSFHHFKEPRRVLGEMVRVVKAGGTVAVADIVGAEDEATSALQNAIEILRDPSHVRMLPASELKSLMGAGGLTIVKQDSWDKPREFEEWADIVADPDRIGPVRILVRALAQAGVDAGMGLSVVDGAIAFFHRWLVVVARKN